MLNNKVSKAVRLAIAFGAASTAAFSASTIAAEEGAEKVERIQVTGSRISRTDMETATPVTVFTSVEIEKTGVSTVAEFLRTNASTGGFNESATLSQAAGASSVGIRGFSSDYTLILLNGRRLPKNSAGGVFTDVNQIPMAAVERIDVLPDGASAVYGSDAVAGVINIITKTDMEGVAAKFKYGAALEHMDGDELQFSLTAGATSGNTNILFAADYFERRPIMAKDREMGGTAYLPNHRGGEGRSSWGIPGSTYVDSTSATDTGWAPWSDCATENVLSNGRCAYDFAPLYQLQPASDRQSILTSISHEYSDDLTFDSQFRYTRAYTHSSNAPAPGSVNISESPFLRDFLINDRYKSNPTLGAKIADEIAAGDGFAYVGRRYIDFPNRQKDNTNETFEAIGGANYLISDNWELDFDIGFSRLTNRQVGKAGQLLVDGVESAFADGTLNPFVVNDCNSAELKDFCEGLNSSIHRTSEYELAFSSLAVSGITGLELPGGEVGVAAGVDVRRENYLDRSDEASISGAVIGGAGSNGGGVFQNEAVFMEVNLPILDNLEASIAVRNDSADWGESDASETTYSAKVSYRPTDDIMLRASYGTGFKAPSLDSLYLASSFGVSKAVDTKLCQAAGNDDNHPDCKEVELNSKSGGNVELEPETSVSYNIGMVYDVTEDLSFTIDYWSLEIENIVGSLGIQEILDEEAKGNLTDLVVRNSSGRIDDTKRTGFVKTDLQNLTEQSATGLNYDIQYSTDLSFGSLTSRLKIEQFLSYESQSSAVQPLCDWIDDEATRDYNANGNFTLDTGDFTTSLNMRFLPGYDSYDKRNTANKSCQLVGYYDVDTKNLDANGDYVDAGESQHFASYVQFDLTGAYHVNENNTVTVGIRNLFDRQPPFSSVNDWPFYSQSTYDNIGRFMYVQYDVKF
ncbi:MULTISPECIES: TonB-dependent receptor [unclassified Pseudoalteromonas]|uniref:TonB-dependent receptor domain-containing protein n=1 Tax=unclassified Pseudoalteromonas TaxID=194690 RepID=UPI000C07A19B|nr:MULTISPECIES: TonB-dependent receptor [unclassified Pseudoalteromonas]MDP2635358.1 TonB-dependent receptor [Pseudoalteromonas sp. 1_MG-2023]PHN89792.1 TonB-dependent receptor [Pseudoalteromonas sp. 3D05]